MRDFIEDLAMIVIVAMILFMAWITIHG